MFYVKFYGQGANIYALLLKADFFRRFFKYYLTISLSNIMECNFSGADVVFGLVVILGRAILEMVKSLSCRKEQRKAFQKIQKIFQACMGRLPFFTGCGERQAFFMPFLSVVDPHHPSVKHKRFLYNVHKYKLFPGSSRNIPLICKLTHLYVI